MMFSIDARLLEYTNVRAAVDTLQNKSRVNRTAPVVTKQLQLLRDAISEIALSNEMDHRQLLASLYGYGTITINGINHNTHGDWFHALSHPFSYVKVKAKAAAAEGATEAAAAAEKAKAERMAAAAEKAKAERMAAAAAAAAADQQRRQQRRRRWQQRLAAVVL